MNLKIWHKKLNKASFKQKRTRYFASIGTKSIHYYWKHIKRCSFPPSFSFFRWISSISIFFHKRINLLLNITAPSSKHTCRCQCEIVLVFMYGTDKYWKLNEKYKNTETKANQMLANTCAHYILTLFHTKKNHTLSQQKWMRFRFKFFWALPTPSSKKEEEESWKHTHTHT